MGYRQLTPELQRLTQPWRALVDGCRYRTDGYGLWVARVLGVQAITLNGVAYLRPERWADTVDCAALLVHEAKHVEQERERGWGSFLRSYLAWKARHPHAEPREHPLEAPAYALADAVRARWEGEEVA